MSNMSAQLPSALSSLDHARSLQDEHLLSMGLHRFKIPEDGNCMFRAVASQLRLDQEKYHLVLRQAAAAWMGQNSQQLLAAGLVDGMAEIVDTGREGSWPGQAALVALSNVLRVNIAVVQGGDQGKVDIQHVTPYEDVQAEAGDGSGVLLAYLYNGHYDAVVHEANVPNPDYALWAAEKHYNDAVSEVVARKLSEESGLPKGIYNILQSDTEKSVSVSSDRSDRSMQSDDRSRGFELYSPKPDQSKVSSMKIDLKPMQNQSQGYGNNQDRKGDRRHGRRPSVENTKSEIISEARHSVLRPSKSADVSRSRMNQRPPVANEMRSSSVQRYERSNSENRSVGNFNSARRSSSPGPRSPYAYISAAVEKEMRKRNNERKLSHGSALPYTYDSTSRIYGVGKQSRDASLERPRTTRQFSEPGNYYNSSGENSRGPSPQKVYNKDNLKKVNTDRKSSWPTSNSTNKKNFGIDLRSSKEKERDRDKEKAEAVLKQNFGVAYKLKPIKQHSLSKDFGKDKEAEEILKAIKERRSSEGTKYIKKDKVTPRPSRPDFGLNVGSQQKVKFDGSPNSPPKTMPKPKIVDKETLINILASESQKSEEQRNGRRASQDSRSSRTSQKDKKIIVIPISVKSNSYEKSNKSEVEQPQSPNKINESPSRRDRARSNRVGYREQDTFPGFTKTRVRSRERRRSRDHTNDGTQPTIRVRKPSSTTDSGFDTVTVVTTPDEPTKKSTQRMPYVGLSPSETRKVNVQVSTEDLEDGRHALKVNEPLKLYSPQLVRQERSAFDPISTSTDSVTIGSQSPVSPLTPLSPRSNQSISSSPTRHMLSPSPGPSIRRVLPSPTRGLVEIPLRPTPEAAEDLAYQQHQQALQDGPPRRRSVVEIQPQPLQTQIVSKKREEASVQIPITHLKSADSKNFEIRDQHRNTVAGGIVNGSEYGQPKQMNVSFRSQQNVQKTPYV